MILELRGWYWVVGLRSTVSAVKRWKMMRLLLGVSFFGNKIGLLLVAFLFFFLFHLRYLERALEMVIVCFSPILLMLGSSGASGCRCQ